MKNLIQYLKDNKIPYQEIDDDFIEINENKHNLVYPTEDNLLFSKKFELLTEYECDYYVYEFGENYFWEKKEDILDPKLNLLKYVGKSTSPIETNNFLGIHGSYELLNGSRLYSDWVKKAKFLECESLGICEKNSLAGTLKFQLECDKNQIKSILGATYTVLREKEDLRYDVKLFVKNKIGWQNILTINKEVLVENNKFITEEKLLTLLEGLFIVLDPKSLDFKDVYSGWYDSSDNIYWQLDTVEFNDNNVDKNYLENLKKYYNSVINPIPLTDAYYLDKQDSEIKIILNQVSGVRESKSNNQYFKDKEDYINELSNLLKDEDELYNLFDIMINNEQYIVDCCDFKIETGVKHLPKYIMTEEEKEKYSDNIDMFWSLIEDGLNKKVPEGQIDRYIDQIEKEYDIIEYGNLQDYFLINWEQMEWCKDNGIMTGLARGSAAGFQTSNLLNITKINPFDYDLIAERFLTKERAKHKIADIDTDIQQLRRDDVKNHLIDKYGVNQCCSVGTYGTLQIKGALKDLSRVNNIDFEEVNYVSLILDKECKTWSDIFKIACKKPRLKNFIKTYPNVFNDLLLALNAKRSPSIHASAFIITPNNKTIYEWFPVKLENKDGVDILVSEWEGTELEEAGYLKQDILGLLQIDKFQKVTELVRENKGIEIDIYNLPLDDKKVYQFLSNGWNQDVFQFGTKGLSEYCTQLKPENINDLIAAVALYRPGAMDNNFHNEYILRKEGEREVDYYSGTEEITKNTYGLLCLHEDSNISTSKGVKKIKNIQVGDFIINESGEFDEVINTKFNGKKETIKISTNFGEELILTPDHEVLTQRGWVQSQNLTKKDLIKAHWVVDERKEDVNDVLALEHWLMGYFIAEGTSKEKSSPYFTVGSYELALKLEKIIHTVLKNKCYTHITKHENGSGGISFRVNVKSTDKKYNGYFCSDYKENELKSLLKKYNLHNKRFNTKSLPTNYSIHTISGIIEGDGCLSTQILRMKNKQLILDIFYSLQSYRIFCSCKHYEDGVSEIYFRDDDDKLKFRIHNIKKGNCLKQYIPSNEVLIDYKKIKPEVRKRYFTLSKINNSFLSYDVLNRIKEGIIGVKHDIWGKVKKIEKFDICNVYDLSIKNKHSFVSGGLVVHNCYQEQIMQICQRLAGFDLTETDDIRRALGKKKAEVLEPYKVKFLENSIANGYSEIEMNELWDAMEKFSGYSFNLSHAAAYGITGYISQWLKVNYPIEFWSTAFHFGKDTKVAGYISEINQIGDISILSPEINKSRGDVFTDFETKTIYWPFSSIKQCGEKAAGQLIEERDKNGKYFSFEEFLDRNKFKGSKVTKQVIENLILSGSFDELENISTVYGRLNLIQKYRRLNSVKIDDTKDLFSVNKSFLNKDWWWILQQKRVSGLATFDYKNMLKEYLSDGVLINTEDFQKEEYSDQRKFVRIGGYITDVEERESKKKGKWCRLTIENNYTFINITIWPDHWGQLSELDLVNKSKCILLMSGEIVYDSFKNCNILQSCDDSEVFVLE